MASRAETIAPRDAGATPANPVPAAARARIGTLPRPPRLGRVIRAALSDTFFDSIRLVAVNLTWGATLVAIVLVALIASTTITPPYWATPLVSPRVLSNR